MAPPSKGLASFILDHGHSEFHLDNRGNITDSELELKDFMHAV